MGWPGSRAKFEFNSWDTDTVLDRSVEQTTIKVSLEGVILPRFDSRSSGSKCHTKRPVGGRRVLSNTTDWQRGLRKLRSKLTVLVHQCGEMVPAQVAGGRHHWFFLG